MGEPQNTHYNKEALSPIDVHSLNQAILHSYNIALDDKRMRVAINDSRMPVSQSFDQLRKDYPVRNEFTHYAVKLDSAHATDCKKLGFSILD